MKRLMSLIILSSIAMAALQSCQQPAAKTSAKGITRTDFGSVDDKSVFLYTLTNSHGDQVRITNYGGTVTSWESGDSSGKRFNIVVGFDSLINYLQKPPYFGALIGRYGNRIAKGHFRLDSTDYTLATNNGPNSLHGGLKGFDKVVWDATTTADSIPSLTLNYISKDGEEGYPGNLRVTVRYDFTDDDGLQITYDAETDKPTVLNLTNHSYFNLTGDVSISILDHTLMLAADAYTPVDTTLIPTGQIALVKGTAFDFTTPRRIGERIDSVPGGYDHNFVLRNGASPAAVLSDPASGRTLSVFTDQPGIQFYSGNFLDGKFINRDGKAIKLHTALCLETQHFPDSPNEPSFPSTVLRPGQKFHSVTSYVLKHR